MKNTVNNNNTFTYDVPLKTTTEKAENATIDDKIVNILGTEYIVRHIKSKTDGYLESNNYAGYCDNMRKLIIILDLNTASDYDNYTVEEKATAMKETIRHEIIHAFFNESGLRENTGIINNLGWAKNEEMVDWIAIQFPKILKVYNDIGCL